MFNAVYGLLGKLAPAFWGHQVGQSLPILIEAANFRFLHHRTVRQNFYPSHVLVAQKLPEIARRFLRTALAGDDNYSRIPSDN